MTSNKFVSPLRFWSSAVGAAGIELGVRAFDRGDFNNALLTFSPLAEAGNAQAQHYLGEMYANGYGVAVEFDTAMQWFRAAAKNGYTPSQRRLAECYTEGECGVRRNATEARKWLSLADDHEETLALARRKA